MKSAISRAPITASTGLSDSAQIVRGGSNLTTVGAFPYVSTSGVLSEAIGITSSTTANVAKLVVKAGSAQNTTNLQEWQNNLGTVLASIQSDARFVAPEFRVGASTSAISIGYNSPQIMTGSANATINWTSGSFTATPDTSLSRIGPGKIGFGTGAAGSVAGEAQAAIFSALGNGAASVPNILGSGAWFTGGSATTTKPYLLIEPSGTTSTGWSTSGTGLGVNAASGFAGNLLDLQVAGASKLTISGAGNFTNAGYVVSQDFLAMAGGNGRFYSSGSGIIELANSTHSDFNRLQFGGTTSAFPALKRSTTGLIARLADDSADTWFQASQFRSTLTTPASAAATGVAGTIVADANYIYVCTATDMWKRVAIATW